jgi:hypothetical protein
MKRSLKSTLASLAFAGLMGGESRSQQTIHASQ